jgi:RNA polymerase sigma-70 factor (ECF subfamily)
MADADLTLVQALQAGDDAALDALMARHQDRLFRFIRGNVLNDADAIELTQETFIRAYFNISRFKPAAKFSTWLYRIALNLCRDHAKSRWTKRVAMTDSLSFSSGDSDAERDLLAAGNTPAEEVLIAEKMGALNQAIAQLPHDLRTALVLSVIDQRSHQECADLLETTSKTIETRIYRARKILLTLMTKAGF